MSGPEGATSLCHLWIIRRADGRDMGFTNHDEDIIYDGIVCQAASGLTGAALQTSTGLSVDNTEALGALQSSMISPADIVQGRYDGAEVRIVLYDWCTGQEVSQQFTASIGEVQVQDSKFVAELRGTTDVLNQPMGRVYQPACDAILGDVRCGIDADLPEYRTEAVVEAVVDQRVLRVSGLNGYSERWFERGTAEIIKDGLPLNATVIKSDKYIDGARIIELWFAANVLIEPGMQVRVTTGCDKRIGTCSAKFNNVANFRGFPNIPGEDWAMSYPSDRLTMDGGRL